MKIKYIKIFFSCIAIVLMTLTLSGCFIDAVYLLEAIKTPRPQNPEITHEEFPFTLVYELNGETITVQDVYVCEFDGYVWRPTNGDWNRTWRGYIKSSKEEEVFFLKSGEDIICGTLGDPAYFMGEVDLAFDLSKYTPHITGTRKYKVGEDGRGYALIREEELLEKYKIRVLHFEIKDRIENFFPE